MDTVDHFAQAGKTCIKCQTFKALDNFTVRHPKTGTRRGECRACRSADSLARYHENPEPFKARTVAWIRTHPERCAENRRRRRNQDLEGARAKERAEDAKRKPARAAYRKANADRIKARHAEYRKRAAEKIKAYNAAYNRANKDAILARVRKCVAAKPDLYQQLHKAAKHRRKVRLMNSGPVEKFSDREIFWRDGWVCQLCGVPVDPTLSHPDPFSASLDHKLPIAKGGGHTRANVQLAHLRCNLSKRDRPV